MAIEEPLDDSVKETMEVPDETPPITPISSLSVKWRPPRPNGPSRTAGSGYESSINNAVSVVGPVRGRGDSSNYSSICRSSSPSETRARLDCPVTPGTVQNRLSAIKGSASSLLISPSLYFLTGKEPGMDRVGTAHSEMTATAPLPRASITESKTATRTYLTRRKPAKLMNKWPPATRKRQDMTCDVKSQQRGTGAAEELHTISRSGFQERRSRFEQSPSQWSRTKASAGSVPMLRSDEHGHPSPLGPEMANRIRFGRETTNESCTASLPVSADIEVKNEGTFRSVVGDEDHSESRIPTQGVWVVGGGFAGGESSSSFCFDEWTMNPENDTLSGDEAPAPTPTDKEPQPQSGQTQHRRTNYRVRYDGPTLLCLEDVRALPESSQEGPCERQSRPSRLPELSRHLLAHAEDGNNRLEVEESMLPRNDDDDDNCDGFNTNGDTHGSPEKKRPDVWMTPLKSRDGSRKWKVKRVWDVEDVDEDEPEYEIDHADLTLSVRDLLGVPDDHSNTSSVRCVSFQDSNKWDVTTNRDAPPTKPRQRSFSLKTFYDVDGDFDGSESSISLDDGQFIRKLSKIAESADHDNVVEEVEYDYSYNGGPKQRAFQRPDDWVSPQGSRQRPTGRKSWKTKVVQPLQTDTSAEDCDDEFNSSVEQRVPYLDPSHSSESLSETSDDQQNVIPPELWLSPLSTSMQNRAKGRTVNSKKKKEQLEVLPKQGDGTRYRTKICDEEPVRGIPTWELESSGNRIEKESLKLWWQE